MLTRSDISHAQRKNPENSSQINSQKAKKIKIINRHNLINEEKPKPKMKKIEENKEKTAFQSSKSSNPESPSNIPDEEEAPTNFPIIIAFKTGHAFTLLVNSTDTIAQVKNEIYKIELIPVDRQRLKLSGRRLLNNETISSVGVRQGTTLEFTLLANRQAPGESINSENCLIHIKPMIGNAFDIYVDLAETIKSLKLKILDAKGIMPREQRLIFEGREIFGVDGIIGDYEISNESTIHLLPLLRGC